MKADLSVVANDYAPSAPQEMARRRGVAGEVLMWKAGGARVFLDGSRLDEVIRCAQKAIDQTRSTGIGLTPCTIPAVGCPNFRIEPGTTEVRIGHHGEPDISVEKLRPAGKIARMLFDVVLPDLPRRVATQWSFSSRGSGRRRLWSFSSSSSALPRCLTAPGSPYTSPTWATSSPLSR
jgi:dihydroxyacetone kinase